MPKDTWDVSLQWLRLQWCMRVPPSLCGSMLFGPESSSITLRQNITRKRYVATPYHALHGEAFADSSIVVPFGCGALILRDSDDRPKFQSKCTLMIFLHYVDEYPMFMYAFFSPRTKRVIYRQDAIFLPAIFSLRSAREISGLNAD